MIKRIVLPALAALALAGCQSGGDEGPANGVDAQPLAANMADGNGADGNAAAENPQARVLAMSDRQRNVVFIRALLDAGLDCQSVKSSERIADQNGTPTWRANCEGRGGSHMISITRDGTANIVSRTDR